MSKRVAYTFTQRINKVVTILVKDVFYSQYTIDCPADYEITHRNDLRKHISEQLSCPISDVKILG